MIIKEKVYISVSNHYKERGGGDNQLNFPQELDGRGLCKMIKESVSSMCLAQKKLENKICLEQKPLECHPKNLKNATLKT